MQVEQASTENSGVATVTVTAEDGTAETYTVTFGELPQLAELAVEVTKDSYQVGDKFNAADVKVSAIYKVGDTETLRKLIDPTDGDLKFTGFDSATAGTKTITVSYRGVNATFEVTVAATEVTPGPESRSPAIPTILATLLSPVTLPRISRLLMALRPFRIRVLPWLPLRSWLWRWQLRLVPCSSSANAAHNHGNC